MSHSPFPWSTHPQVTSAVFDADGKRIVDAWHPIDTETAADNAALIAAIPAMIEALQVARTMIHGEMIEGAVVDAKTMQSLGGLLDAVLASIGKTP